MELDVIEDTVEDAELTLIEDCAEELDMEEIEMVVCGSAELVVLLLLTGEIGLADEVDAEPVRLDDVDVDVDEPD